MGLYKAIKRRGPWFTFFFTLFFGPVIGMLYLNRGWLAIIYLLITVAVISIESYFLEPLYDPSTFEMIAIADTIALYLIAAIHAFYLALNFNKYEDLKWFSRIIPPIAVFIIVLIPCMLAGRIFLYEPFNIPSGSMEPTFSTGDVLFAKKSAYGYSKYAIPFKLGASLSNGKIFHKRPNRGDAVIFALPKNPKIDYFKRIIGLPGDTVQMKNGMLYINDQKVERKKIEPYQLSDDKLLDQYIETLPNGRQYNVLNETDTESFDNTPLYTVPDGYYFVMGDNRDHSHDSRVFGAVHKDYLIGLASILIKDGRIGTYTFRNVESQ